MSDEYQGQPDYVRAGFWADLLEEWQHALTNDEWGEWVNSLINVMSHGLSVSQEEKVLVLVGWVRDELQAVWDQQDEMWIDDYADEINKAREAYDRTVEYWRQRAVGFKADDAIEEEIRDVPEWMRPPTTDEKLERERTKLTEQLQDAEARVATLQTKLQELEK